MIRRGDPLFLQIGLSLGEARSIDGFVEGFGICDWSSLDRDMFVVERRSTIFDKDGLAEITHPNPLVLQAPFEAWRCELIGLAIEFDGEIFGDDAFFGVDEYAE